MYTDNRIMLYASSFRTFYLKDVSISIPTAKIPLLESRTSTLESRTSTLESDIQFDSNIIPDSSQLDANTELNVSNEGKGISAGWFDIRYPNDVNNSVNKLTSETDGTYFEVHLNSSGGINPAFWAINKIPVSYQGKSLILEFDVKGNASGSFTINAQGNQYDTNFTTEWQRKSIDVIFGTSPNDMRLMFYVWSSIVFQIKKISAWEKD